jgi:hypothetical protein
MIARVLPSLPLDMWLLLKIYPQAHGYVDVPGLIGFSVGAIISFHGSSNWAELRSPFPCVGLRGIFDSGKDL